MRERTWSESVYSQKWPKAYVQMTSAVKPVMATSSWQHPGMGKPGENLRKNVQALMVKHGDDTVSLSRKCGIPQRTLYRLIYTEQKVSVDQADQIAAAYGYNGWQIIMNELPESPRKLARVLDGYLESNARDKDLIERLTNHKNGA